MLSGIFIDSIPVFLNFLAWNKHKSEMTMQPENNNLVYMIDPAFTNTNRFFEVKYNCHVVDRFKKY